MCDKLYIKQLNKKNDEDASEKYKSYRNTFIKNKRKAKSTYFANLFNKYRYDMRNTWKIINNQRGKLNDKSSLPNLFKVENKEITDPKDIADGFCNYFTNIGKKF